MSPVTRDLSPPDMCSTDLDCEIDDILLLTTKKHLMSKHTPLSLVNILQSKHKALNIIESLEEDKTRFTKLNLNFRAEI